MENNVVQMNTHVKKQQAKNPIDDLAGFSFADEVDKDIAKLMEATGLTREESVQLAKDFYRRYPMLMEFIRTPNEMLRR